MYNNLTLLNSSNNYKRYLHLYYKVMEQHTFYLKAKLDVFTSSYRVTIQTKNTRQILKNQ